MKIHSMRTIGPVLGLDFEVFSRLDEVKDACAFNIIRLGLYISEHRSEIKSSYPNIDLDGIVNVGKALTNITEQVSDEALWNAVQTVFCLEEAIGHRT